MAGLLGIIAGAGDFPIDVAERCHREGRPHLLLRLQGFADPKLDNYDGLTIPIGRFGFALRTLRRARCDRLLFCGKVWRPGWRNIGLDLGGVVEVLRLLTGAWYNDDPLQRAVAASFERRGIKVVGPAEVWPDLLVGKASLAQALPSDSDWIDIRSAVRGALEVGRTDRGQGAVARDGRVVSVEGRDHTEGLLRRVQETVGRGGVLVKLAKPAQDRRLDLPVIGPETIRQAIDARLAGVAVEAGATILTRRAETIALADEAGLFIVGVRPEEFAP